MTALPVDPRIPGRSPTLGWLALFWVLARPASASSQAALSVTAGFDTARWLAPDAALELRLSRPLESGEGRIAVFIGPTDLTALFTVTADRVTYRPGAVPLPPGETELVAYTVLPNGEWQEIGRVPLRVLTPSGFEKAQLAPKVALNNKGQVLEGHDPAENRPPRLEFQDFSLNLGLQSEHVRSGWTVRTQSNFLGVTNRQEALRFGQRADAAPRFDLSDYLVTVERGRALISAGNLSYGTHRHIISGFEGRGLSTVLRLGSVASLTLAGLSGSRLVGWSNPLGLSQPRHRLLGGTLGLDPFPRRPRLVRLEVSLFKGEVLPQTGFSQGAVIEAEDSRSAGVRLSLSDPSQRIQLEAGYARTRFANPFDPTLAQGATLVPVQPTTRGARYADLTYNILRSLPLTPSLPVNLAVTVRHERVDPLYRSVAAPQARADLEQNGLQVSAGVGALSAQLVHSRGQDNLAEIPTILTTLTRSTTVNLAFPLGSLFGPTPRSWLPMVTYGLAQIHQFGDSVPTLGGFTPTFVPDQASTNHTLGVAWQAGQWRVLYQLNRSSQDNRQPGRESSDLVNQTHNVGVGLSPLSALDITLDLGVERAENREFSQRNSTRRVGTLVTWRLTRTSALVGSVSHTRLADEPRTAEQSNTELRLEASQRITLFRAGSARPTAQLFLRYARLLGDRLVPPGSTDPRRNWSLNTGFALSGF